MTHRFFRASALAFSLSLLLLPLGACKKGSSAPEGDRAAIQEAVLTYVRDAKKVSVENLDVTLKDVVIQGEKATCTAAFAPKKEPTAIFAYSYELEKSAGRWAVSRSAPVGAVHGEAASPGAGMPAGHPPMDGSAPPGEGPAMPPGHPPVSPPPGPAEGKAMPSHPPAQPEKAPGT